MAPYDLLARVLIRARLFLCMLPLEVLLAKQLYGLRNTRIWRFLRLSARTVRKFFFT